MKTATCDDCKRKECDRRNKIRQPVKVGADIYCYQFLPKNDFFMEGATNEKTCTNCKCGADGKCH